MATQVTIRIHERYFVGTQLPLRGLMHEGSRIGGVYFPGHWNDWGESHRRPGHIKPDSSFRARREGVIYALDVELPRGAHRFKPVVVLTEPDEDGFCDARWIECPQEGAEGYLCDPKRGNWIVVVE